MAGFVYLWRDKKNKRYYVGSHWGPDDDGYICSSRWMRKSYSRRPEDFTRRIISRVTSSRIDLLIEEERWLQMIRPDEVKIRYYNLRRDTQHLWHAHEGEAKLSIGQKISAAKMGKSPAWVDPTERGRKISEGKKKAFESKLNETGSKFTPEHIEKISTSKKAAGHTHTDEWKKANGQRLRQQYADGTRVNKGHKKARVITLCKICGIDTLNPRKNFCSKEHRYQAMNATRSSKTGSKWCNA